MRPITDSRDFASEIDIRSARLPSTLSLTDFSKFDPRDHREPTSPITVWMAYFNLIRTELGAGVLGVPLAISQAGIVVGPMLACFTACLIIHMHVTLLNCLNEISKHMRVSHISYRYGFRLAVLHGPEIFRPFARKGPTIIATFMILSQLGIGTVFVTFTTDSLRDIMDWDQNKYALLSLLGPYLVLAYLMKNLKIVSYISLMGTLFNVIGLLIVFYHIFRTARGEYKYGTIDALPLLFAFGTFLFNQSAVGVILSLDRCLPHPKVITDRFGVINIGILVPVVISTVFGTLGYWAFGVMEENVLRSLPYDETSSMVCIALYLVAIGFAYPIQCYPAIAIILEIIINYENYDRDSPSTKALKILEQIARPLFVLLTFGICYFVPFQGPFVAFVGNVCTTMLALVFPSMMELCLMYPGPFGKYNHILIKNLIIICLGLVSFIFGAFLCGYLIYIRILAMKSGHTEDF